MRRTDSVNGQPWRSVDGSTVDERWLAAKEGEKEKVAAWIVMGIDPDVPTRGVVSEVHREGAEAIESAVAAKDKDHTERDVAVVAWRKAEVPEVGQSVRLSEMENSGAGQVVFDLPVVEREPTTQGKYVLLEVENDNGQRTATVHSLHEEVKDAGAARMERAKATITDGRLLVMVKRPEGVELEVGQEFEFGNQLVSSVSFVRVLTGPRVEPEWGKDLEVGDEARELATDFAVMRDADLWEMSDCLGREDFEKYYKEDRKEFEKHIGSPGEGHDIEYER